MSLPVGPHAAGAGVEEEDGGLEVGLARELLEDEEAGLGPGVPLKGLHGDVGHHQGAEAGAEPVQHESVGAAEEVGLGEDDAHPPPGLRSQVGEFQEG